MNAVDALNISSLPAPTPENLRLMKTAAPCPSCGGTKLFPVSDGAHPAIIAIACDDCGEIEGDAPSLELAVTNWSRGER